MAHTDLHLSVLRALERRLHPRPLTPGRGTCLQAMSREVTPSSWKQSAATGVVVRKRSRVFTVRHSDSKERPNWRCTGINQLSSLQRDSAVTCGEGGGWLNL